MTIVGAYLWNLPRVLVTPPEQKQVINVFDRQGIKLKAYAPGDSFDWAPLREIPPELIGLMIYAEDKNFFNHHGVDFKSLLRSSWINLKEQRLATGASTITQQLYRLHNNIPRTFSGKVKTMFGSLVIETQYSKRDILSHYLNSVPFGKQVVGVKRASEVFFGKPLHLLSMSEMATLAVLPRSPSYLLSEKGRPILLKIRNDLILSFGKSHFIPNDILAYEMKNPVEIQKNYNGWDNYHFFKKVISDAKLPKYLKGGDVYTTVDAYYQKEISEILRSHLASVKKYNVHHGAVIVLDNRSGDVLGYVGSANVNDDKGGFFDALIEKRQPGSALKPFTYALSLMNGKQLAETLPDIPSYYKSGLGQYLPRNYDHDFSGPRLMRESLANSLNLPAVALADELGVHKLHQFLKDMGLTLEKDAEFYGVGLTLGNAEISPVELAASYSAFSHGEYANVPKYYLDEEQKTKPVPLTKEAAFMIRNVLSDNLARIESFGEGNIFELPFEASVKTGTSTDFRDNWAVGFNKLYTVVVWVGNMNQEPMKKVSGITGAGPILADTLKFLMKGRFIEKDRMPESLSRHEICALSGQKPGPHCRHKKFEYFTGKTGPEHECNFHREVIVRNCLETGDEVKLPIAVYPENYQSFVSVRPKWSVEGQIGELCRNAEAQVADLGMTSRDEIRIKKPLHGSIYAIDPNIPKDMQKLKFELDGHLGVKSVLWKLDALEMRNDKSDLDWEMQKGKHTIKATVEMNNGKILETHPIEVTVL